MPRGGARPGAGRKKGARNRITEMRQEMITRAAHRGESPLECLLRIMRTTEDQAVMLDCAKAAAPYVHPRLASIEANVNATVHHEDAIAQIDAVIASAQMTTDAESADVVTH